MVGFCPAAEEPPLRADKPTLYKVRYTDGDEQELSDEEPGQWEVYDEEEGWLLW